MGIKGAILGDIAGSKWEFCGCKNYKTCNLFDKDNFFTDDTILSCATKYAVDTNTSFEEAYRKFAEKYLWYIPAGWGTNFFMWVRGGSHRQSIGNGSAMRVSYIGEKYKTVEEVKKKARESAETTHNTPEAIKGAIVTAVCVWMAKQGYSKEDIYKYACTEYEDVNKSIGQFRVNYKWSELCRNSVPLAVRAFYESTDFESCMRNVLSVKCDTDTICAIAGAIADSYYGSTENVDEIIHTYLDKYLIEVLYS